MKLFLTIILSLFFVFLENSAQAENSNCAVDAQVFQNNLPLDFNSFDQNLTGGWRVLANKGCYLQAGLLVDSYHLQNLNKVLDWQDRILYWHAGQMFAFQNVYSIAISRFEKSINPKETASDPFKWNAYVYASIAFLKGDLETLKQKRIELASVADTGSKKNLEIVDSFIKCFGKPYSQAYRSAEGCH